VRSARVGAARADLEAASLRTELERARVRYDVTVAYAEASAAREIMVVSHQTVADGDELVRIARVRRDAGDAADLDVDLATVNAAQLRSTMLSDSLALVTATLKLQAEMGLPVDAVVLVTADSLAVPLPVAPPAVLEVGASEAEQRAARLRLSQERSARLPGLAARVGFEHGSPDEPGMLWMAGVTVSLPTPRRGPVGEAQAELDKATAQLALARTHASLAASQGERARTLAQSRLEQDRIAVAAAQQVARRSLNAYQEGAYALTAVMEAQRSAREAIRQYLDDLGTLWSAQAAATLAVVAGVQP
jgi:cobalt-zinc-cadmium efflux system outer membrane protein